MASCLHNFMLVDQDLLRMVEYVSFFKFLAETIIKICLELLRLRTHDPDIQMT